MKQYDESEAIKIMRAALPDDVATQYDDDELLNVIDMIWDFYEQNGMLDVDADPDDDDSNIASELIDYTRRMLKKDKMAKIAPEHVEVLVLAELAYEEALESSL